MDTEHEDRLEHRRDELRRIVYGTPGGATEEDAAELGAIERELAERDRRAAGAAVASVTDDARASVTEADAAGSITDRATARRARRRLLAAGIAVLALIGAGIGLSVPVREALSPPQGLGVFDRAPAAEELERGGRVATFARLSPDEATTLRSLGRVFGYDFWVYRNTNQVCLLSQRPFFFEWVRSCSSHAGFERFGLSRRIVGDDIRDGARPRRIRPDDIVVVTWGPESTEVEWEVLPAPPEGSAPMTYEEWSSARRTAGVGPDGR
jgi:hypothetical protein